MARFVWGLLTLLLAACGPFPRDIDDTLQGIHERGTIRVGLVTMRDVDEPLARDFLARLQRESGARVVTERGPAELQLARLDQGALDLVLGDFASDSPWLPEVAIVEPIVDRPAGDRSLGLSPVAANGENRWVGVLEKTVRDIREDAGRE
ncbi:hypothetical protein [Tsuneonella rigui]|uniref:hypothetical protein n=1 Tax=Tsuneonella rigui TaxID=1708790 RepID=UPI000F7F1D24|nr:hypothetical protein [Tsuneonella rigui]